MYSKNIGLHFAYLLNKLKKRNIFEKTIFCKIVIFFKQDHKVIHSTPKFDQF